MKERNGGETDGTNPETDMNNGEFIEMVISFFAEEVINGKSEVLGKNEEVAGKKAVETTGD